jgi:hypothetical protein
MRLGISGEVLSLSATSTLADLTFTGRRTDGVVNLWDHNVEGDWDTQCSMGRDFGREACLYIRLTGNVTLLPAIVRTINEQGSFGGVEVGFFTALSEQLVQ